MDYIQGGENKEFLWNILYEKNIFQGIPDDKLDKVKNIFEYVIVNVSQNTKNNEILEINKEILTKLNREILSLKKNLFESKNTKDEFKDEKIKVFDKNLETHKISLNELINLDKPNEIDFTDQTDKPIDNNEMNKILEEMQKERNITGDNVEINISDKNIIKPDTIMNNSNTTPKLKIESIEELLQTEVIDLKNPVNNIIEELKIEDNKIKDINEILRNEYILENEVNTNQKIDSIYSILNKVLNNQEKIMSKLEVI